VPYLCLELIAHPGRHRKVEMVSPDPALYTNHSGSMQPHSSSGLYSLSNLMRPSLPGSADINNSACISHLGMDLPALRQIIAFLALTSFACRCRFFQPACLLIWSSTIAEASYPFEGSQKNGSAASRVSSGRKRYAGSSVSLGKWQFAGLGLKECWLWVEERTRQSPPAFTFVSEPQQTL
jgi:hypothetical protein